MVKALADMKVEGKTLIILPENNKNVAELMNRIASVEKTHAELYNKTIQDLNAKKTLPTVYYLCPVC